MIPKPATNQVSFHPTLIAVTQSTVTATFGIEHRLERSIERNRQTERERERERGPGGPFVSCHGRSGYVEIR